MPLAGAAPAPPALGTWGDSRRAIHAALAPLKLPGDAVLLVGEGRLQQDWAEAGRLAGFLPGDRFFAPAAAWVSLTLIAASRQPGPAISMS